MLYFSQKEDFLTNFQKLFFEAINSNWDNCCFNLSRLKNQEKDLSYVKLLTFHQQVFDGAYRTSAKPIAFFALCCPTRTPCVCQRQQNH